MSKTFKYGVLTVILVATAAGSYFVGKSSVSEKIGGSVAYMDPGPGKDLSSSGVTSEDSADRKILYWRAPMVPTEIYDKPGKSAMGMDLVPVYEDEAPSGRSGEVTISPATVQNMGVRTAEVERTDFSRTIRTVGKIEYNEESFYSVNTKVSGWVESLYINFTGQTVTKGEPLLDIYSPELVSSQEEFLLARNNYERVKDSPSQSLRNDAMAVLRAAGDRLRFLDVPESTIERLESTGEVKRTVVLESPASGIVVSKTVVDGAFVEPGTNLYEIANLSPVWVHASVYDYEVPWIAEGQKAKMGLAYLPEKTYEGTVSYIYPYLRDQARDVHVRLVFENPQLDLKPGMYVNVELETRVMSDALVIPTEAVLRSGQRMIVFVDRGGGSYDPREIRIAEEGGPGNRFVRVLSGLNEGERVVTSAQFMLDSESRLQEVIAKMLVEDSP
jgi:RND family efflux transporter MFP subunit